MKIAGAPISWGVCEVPGWGYQLDPSQVLQEMADLGIEATEFGPQGWLPVAPTERAAAIAPFGLKAVGAFVPVLLHVGLGTFRPVKEDDVADHHMHSEYYEVTPEQAEAINAARARGGRIVCVGTTSVRTLETVATEDGVVHPGSGFTQIFITPGVKIKAVDALITNFHLPQSTLLMLISALMGRENALDVYRQAVEERYRFFSFGDAMMITGKPQKDI